MEKKINSTTSLATSRNKMRSVMPTRNAMGGYIVPEGGKPLTSLATRNAMGGYIVPEGGKPLTSLGDAGPGPADYTLSTELTKTSAPQYSIVGRYRSKPSGQGIPGPADYSTTGNLIWKNKKSTLKGRGKSNFDEEAAKSVTLIGPAKYNIKHKHVGKDGPQHTIARKQSSVVYTGPPNSSIQPVDTHGFQTPGPNYRPNSRYWKRGPEKSFGSAARKAANLNVPGPGEYSPSEARRGPTYSFGIKLPPPPSVQMSVSKDSPAPNTYNLGSTIGTATSVTLSRRKEEQEQEFKGPSPATYYPRNSMEYSKKSITLAYRWFDSEESTSPGPADYTVSHKNLKNFPSYSHRKRTKPSFPDSLHYVAKSEGEIPGPGNYNLSRDFVKNDAPAFSMRQKVTNGESTVPAPNSYSAERHDIPGSRKAPSFSMGKRFVFPDSKISPGPAAYFPSVQDSSPKYTMTSRPRKSKGKTGNPAANAYKLPSEFAEKSGATFKSRPSPYVYSGFRTTKIIEPNNSPSIQLRA